MSQTQQLGTAAFNDACKRVCRAAKSAKPGSLIHYAATYASAGRHMTDRREIRVQALYILSNLSHWRGDEARTVKAVFKQFAAEA